MRKYMSYLCQDKQIINIYTLALTIHTATKKTKTKTLYLHVFIHKR